MSPCSLSVFPPFLFPPPFLPLRSSLDAEESGCLLAGPSAPLPAEHTTKEGGGRDVAQPSLEESASLSGEVGSPALLLTRRTLSASPVTRSACSTVKETLRSRAGS